MIRKLKNTIGNWLRRRLMMKKEIISDRPGKFSEREIEYAFVFEHLHHAPGYRLLEVAPGKSGFSLPLRHSGYEVTAIDLDVAHPWVLKGDATKLQFEDNSFDVAISISVFEHIPNVDEAINEMIRVVIPGGIIMLSFPYNPETYVDDIYKGEAEGYIVSIYDDNKLKQWFDGKAETIATDYWKQWTGKLFGEGEKLPTPDGAFRRTIRVPKEEAQGICICLRKI